MNTIQTLIAINSNKTVGNYRCYLSTILAIIFTLCSLAVTATTYYIAPNGSDSNNGDITHPFATLNKAWTVIAAGDTIYLHGGTYLFNTQQVLRYKDGTAGNLIKVWAYPGEIPILSKSSGYIASRGIYFIGNYVHFKGLEIMGYTQIDQYVSSGIRIENSNYNIFELLNIHHNGCGLDMANYEFTAHSTGNIILNCDFHHNQDPLTTYDPYGNADGLSMIWITHPEDTNYVKGCRSWSNSDDGYDFDSNDGMVYVENCWSWNNGYIPDTYTTGGNGNGFKLGLPGEGTLDQSTIIKRKVTNCVSFNNRDWAYHENGAKCNMEVYNNIAYNNVVGGFHFNVGTIPYILRNNISYGPNKKDFNAQTIHDHNTWNGGVTLTTADFASVNSTGADGPRQSDGSLPELAFLHLDSGSDLIDYGIDVDLPYNGSAPDLGAFEFTSGDNQSPSILDQSFQIDENSPDGTEVGTVMASDPDAGQTLEYSIVSGNTDGAFSINTSTGMLSVANSAVLNVDFALVVKVLDNGTGYLSSQATVTINIIPTGIESTGNNSTIEVYPNPVSDELIIEIEGNNDRQGFEILNSIGYIVYKGILSERTVVPTTNFSPGVYLIKIENDRSFELKKIVRL